MLDNEKKINVFASWIPCCPQVGTLYTSVSHGAQVYSFEFADSWLKNYSFITLDPDLYATRGRQFVPQDKKIFGMFSDCAPDRWGRTLLKRKEAILAKDENRAPRTLHEIDFLLGVNDETRMGGFRFRLDGEAEFLSAADSFDVPPVASLRELEHSSLEFEKSENPFEKKWLVQLLSPGSSLGGARPKATVKDTGGSIWIAKFPSKNDEFNTGAWEYVASRLAKICGLDVPETELKTFNKKGSTFLSKRFDRICSNGVSTRVHYESAMTLLGKTDGASFRDGTSYLEIAEFIKSHSVQPKKDLTELWKRIVLNILVSNTDDHLRNHGFILSKNGWHLSPLFDVNPNPEGEFLSLNITESGNEKNLELALESAEYYGIGAKEAGRIAGEMSKIVRKNWSVLARENGISSKEIELMENAFAK